MDKDALVKLLQEHSEDQQTTASALRELMEESQGTLSQDTDMLSQERPDLFTAMALRSLRPLVGLDAVTAALISIGVTAALRSPDQLQTQIARALAAGASRDQILDALAVAGGLADSVTQSAGLAALYRAASVDGIVPTLPEEQPQEESSAAEPGRRRRGRPRGFKDRAAFWEEVVAEFQKRAPRITISSGRSPRVRSARLGRGQQARLEWAFRRRRGFSVQMVLNATDMDENLARLTELEAMRPQLEKEIGARLVFEAGRGRQARVAAHYQGSSQLNEAMRDWAVDKMLRFHTAFRTRLQGISPD